jgi:hypothetical protein
MGKAAIVLIGANDYFGTITVRGRSKPPVTSAKGKVRLRNKSQTQDCFPQIYRRFKGNVLVLPEVTDEQALFIFKQLGINTASLDADLKAQAIEFYSDVFEAAKRQRELLAQREEVAQ